MRLHRPVLAVLAVFSVLAPTAAAHEEGELGAHYTRRALLAAPSTAGTATGGMTFVANRQYQTLTPTSAQNGSDIEFLRVGSKDYAVAGTLRNGMQIVDITDPTNPVIAAVYDCPINQGDVQVFRQGGRILATYTADSMLGATRTGSACARELGLVGTSVGTVLVDLTNPLAPKGLSFIPIALGSHNMTVHPSGNFLYNSNAELATNAMPRVEVIDISDPLQPRQVFELRYPNLPDSLGTNPHDVAFNESGTRGYVAALSTTLILDTANPALPRLLTQIQDPKVNLEHDVKLVSLPRAGSTPRELLLVGDELAGAVGVNQCPGGGITVYDVTGPLELAPLKLGVWFIPDVTGTTGPANPADAQSTGVTTCTAHVFKTYPEQGLLTIAWYKRGARVLDMSGLATYPTNPAIDAGVKDPVTGIYNFPPTAGDTAFGDGIGLKEVGSFFFSADSDAWSFKTNRIATDGSFFGFANDLERGFDVFRFPGGLGRTVPALEPADLGAGLPAAVIPEVPVNVLLPALAAAALGGAVLRRRRASGRSVPAQG